MNTTTKIIYSTLASVLLACYGLLHIAKGMPDPSTVNGMDNTADGANALSSITIGADNSAFGFAALEKNADGVENTAVGSIALDSNTSGHDNTAVGFAVLINNNSSYNTATGSVALELNVGGSNNTATGFQALQNNDADDNTATGYAALRGNTNGTQNTASGVQALYSNVGGSTNTAVGFDALLNNKSGSINTATGAYALFSNTSGQSNVATGVDALYHNQTGHDNTADGYGALLNSKGSNNTALGSNAGQNLTTGSNNIILGANVLGNTADASITRIGNTTQKKAFIGGIYGKTVASGVVVIINSAGQLGTVQSSARFKDDIKPMDKASETLLKLKPVTFRYKEELDPDKVPQFGLVAEEVEKVNPDLVVRDEDGKVNTVRYEAVNAMLLNEFLKAHRELEEQRAIIAKQQKQIDALTARMHKVSGELELSRTDVRRIVDN